MFRSDGPIAESSFDVASLSDRRDLSSVVTDTLRNRPLTLRAFPTGVTCVRGDRHIAESSVDVASLSDRRDLSSAAAGSLSSPAAGPLYSGGAFLPRRWERLSSHGELGSYPPLSEGLGS